MSRQQWNATASNRATSVEKAEAVNDDRRAPTRLSPLAPCSWLLMGIPICLLAAPCAGEITPFTEEAINRGIVYEMRPYGLSGGQALGFGAAIVDLTGNGHQDIILLGEINGLVGFFENDGAGFFTDRSYKLGGQGQPQAKFKLSRPSGIAVGDYNGNGMLDVYLTEELNQSSGQKHPNLLLRNDGDFNFTDVAAEAGVANMGHSQGAAWADFDNDGWLDLYVANYKFPTQQSDPDHWNKLYRNLGDGTFDEIGVQQNVNDKGMSFTAAFTDINRNGWLDLYIANDRGHYTGLPPNQLWRNNQGQFENICDTSESCLGLYAMCVAVGDFSGNGYPDIYVTNIAHPSGYNGWNPLLINQGDETFVEQCNEAEVCQIITSWAGIFFDYDNNGWLDLYVCNQNENQPNNLFANDGTFPTTKVTQQAAVGGSPRRSYNAAVGDVTGNGALDILLNNYGPWGGDPANVELFINHEGAKRNWIRFNVVGYDANVHAIGANIEVTTDGHAQWREIYAGGNNYKAQNELVFHFGLADALQADQIVVNWPGGRTTRTLSNYPANQTWTIYPPEKLGDANGDGVIDVFDLIALITAWGPVTPGNEIMDLNGDGMIDVFDLIALISAWGPVP